MKVTMWLARSQSGALRMFPQRPIRYKTMLRIEMWTCGTADSIDLPAGSYPEVTYSNSPAKCEVEISDVQALPVNTLQIENLCATS